MRLITPGRLIMAGLVLVVVVLGLYIIPSNEYIFLPDTAHPVLPLVTVPNAHRPAKGGVYFVDVIVRKATILEKLLGGIHEGADLYPANEVNPPGVNNAQLERIDLQDMATSQQVAAAVAERADGLKVVIRQIGAEVEEVVPGGPSVGKLEPDDVVTGIDGKPVRNLAGLLQIMSTHTPGDTVAYSIRRGHRALVERIKTIADPQNKKHALVGIVPEPALDIHVPIPVKIDAGGVGGPSAGVAFALEVLQLLGKNVLHGHKIAATGELAVNGAVEPIGGVKQKTIGARRAGVDAFLVPAGENAQDARKVADGLRIIPVKSFQQALHALATLR
ncbi:MAG TPA: S16 family serine protease [Gaiellaceae bacterium]|jgi:PDZ domain-containing protein|nr:S16 family serine protease [Gaiellaceae bacterium]